MLAGCGSSTAGLIFGGVKTGQNAIVQMFDGSAWTVKNPLSAGRGYSSGAGITTDAVVISGNTTPVLTTERFNGTTWAAGIPVNVARYTLGASGSVAATLSFGGSISGGTMSAVTELFS